MSAEPVKEIPSHQELTNVVGKHVLNMPASIQIILDPAYAIYSKYVPVVGSQMIKTT